MVAVSVLPVSATLGTSKPLLVAVTSKAEEANGVVVPMPTWAKLLVTNTKKNKVVWQIIFILIWV